MSTFCAKIGEFSYFLWNSSKSPPFWINPTDPHPQKSVPPFGPKIPQNGKIPPFWPHWRKTSIDNFMHEYSEFQTLFIGQFIVYKTRDTETATAGATDEKRQRWDLGWDELNWTKCLLILSFSVYQAVCLIVSAIVLMWAHFKHWWRKKFQSGAFFKVIGTL